MAIAIFLSGCQYFVPADDTPKMKTTTKVFYDMPDVGKKNRSIDYDISLGIETYKLVQPVDFDKEQTYGLVLFCSPNDNGSPPQGFDSILAQRKLLMLGPDKIGNEQDPARRMGVALLGVLSMQKEYKIDPKRIYAAGMSGGSRIASDLAFHKPDIFSGTIQSVGSDFPREVPQPHASNSEARDGPYGRMRGEGDVDTKKVKENVRFVIITGPKDFRYGNLKDIYDNGFKKDGYQAEFIDVPDMGHTICDPEAFTKALDFIEGTKS